MLILKDLQVKPLEGRDVEISFLVNSIYYAIPLVQIIDYKHCYGDFAEFVEDSNILITVMSRKIHLWLD